MDFEAKRVQDLFKDETKSELKEGITTRDINSIAGMTPLNRSDLQNDLQLAYRLIYDKTVNQESTQARMPNIPTTNISSNPIQMNVPMVENNMQQQSKENPGEQFMDMYKKIQEEKKVAGEVAETPSKGNYYDNKIKELENLILEKDKEIESLKKDKETLMNQQYDLENEHIEKYKKLNEKYEDLKDSKESTGNSSELESYLKETIARLESKQSILLQENGKLKGMLGL